MKLFINLIFALLLYITIYHVGVYVASNFPEKILIFLVIFVIFIFFITYKFFDGNKIPAFFESLGNIDERHCIIKKLIHRTLLALIIILIIYIADIIDNREIIYVKSYSKLIGSFLIVVFLSVIPFIPQLIYTIYYSILVIVGKAEKPPDYLLSFISTFYPIHDINNGFVLIPILALLCLLNET